MGFFKKKDYSQEMAIFRELFNETADKMADAFESYQGDCELDHLAYPLLIIFADYAAFTTHFKGAGEITKFQNELIEMLKNEGVEFEKYMKMKVAYRKTISKPLVPTMEHIDESALSEGMDNMICRCSIILTQGMYNVDSIKYNLTGASVPSRFYYTTLTNKITEIVSDYFFKLCDVFEGVGNC